MRANEEAAQKEVETRNPGQGQRKAQDVVEDVSGKYRDRSARDRQCDRDPEGRLRKKV